MTAKSGGMGIDMSAYERLEPSFAELDSGDEHLHQIFQEEFEPEEAQTKRRIPFLIISSLLLVAVVGGGLAFAYKQGVREGNRSAPPVIKSSGKPLKVKPVQPGGIIIPNQNKLVYDRLDGKPAKITERLMPAPEDVMDLPRKPNQERMLPAEPVISSGSGADITSADPATRNASIRNVPPPPINTADKTPLRSREVETFTITPQGVYRNSAPPEPQPVKETVVASMPAVDPPKEVPSPVSGPSAPVMEQPPVVSEIRANNKPDGSTPVPADSGRGAAAPVSGSEPSLSMGNGKTNSTAAKAVENPNPPATGATVSDLIRTGNQEPVKESVMMPGTTAAPPVAEETGAPSFDPPLPRPNPLRGQRVASIERTEPVASITPKTIEVAKPAAQPAVKASGRYVVQIASHRKQVDALSEFASLQRRHPKAVGSYQPLIQRADLGERGIYYRLRIGPAESKEEAVKLCSALKAAGKAECLIRRR